MPPLTSELNQCQDHPCDTTDDSDSDPGVRSYYEGASTVSTIYPEDSASAVNPNTRPDEIVPSEGLKSEKSVITFHSSADGYLVGCWTLQLQDHRHLINSSVMKFRDLHGRTFSSQSDTYLLPGDEPEHRRLDMQHRVLALLHKGLYVSKDLVEHELRQGQALRPGVLDVGTGSGSWAIEMAQQFPHADVIGTDLVPPVVDGAEQIPPNCRFEVDDANLSLDHYSKQFNVVHIRSAEGGIHDYEAFLYEVARTIRPGGILLLGAGFPDVRGEDLESSPFLKLGELGFSWTQWMFTTCRNAHYSRGNYGLDSGLKWHSWLEQNPNYQDVVTKDFYVPIGPWKPDMSVEDTAIANLMRDDIQMLMMSFRPLLLAQGHLSGDMRDASQNAISEMQDLRIHGYIRWRFTTAVRAEGEWHERMEQPKPI